MWPGEDQVGARGDERAQHLVPRCDTGLLRAARHGAPSMWWWSTTTRYAPSAAAASRSAASRSCDSSSAPPWWRYGRAELRPTTWQARGRVRRLGRLPDPLELGPRAREPGGERVRKVVVARHGEHRRPERDGGSVGPLVLARGVRDWSGRRRRRSARGRSASTSRASAALDFWVLVCTRVEIG